jgi:hypothetical protein
MRLGSGANRQRAWDVLTRWFGTVMHRLFPHAFVAEPDRTLAAQSGA